jgi:hypothetical protein
VKFVVAAKPWGQTVVFLENRLHSSIKQYTMSDSEDDEEPRSVGVQSGLSSAKTPPTVVSSLDVLSIAFQSDETSPERKQFIESMVKNIVAKQVFAKVKFVQASELDYSESETSLPQRIARICNIPPLDVPKWWKSAKPFVRRSIALLRTQKNGQVKEAFMGK